MYWSPPNPFDSDIDTLAPLDDEARPQITTPITRKPEPKHVPRPQATLAYANKLRQTKIQAKDVGNSRSASSGSTAPLLVNGSQENVSTEEAKAKNRRTTEREIIAHMRRCGLEPCLDERINEKCTLPTFAISDSMRINYNGRKKMPVFFDEQFFKFKSGRGESSTDSTSTDDIFDEYQDRVFGVERGTFGDESGTFRGANGSYRVARGLCYASNESFYPSSEPPLVGSNAPTDTSKELYDPSNVVYDGGSKYRTRKSHYSSNEAFFPSEDANYPSKDSHYPSKESYYSREDYYLNEASNPSEKAYYQSRESYYPSREHRYSSRSSYRPSRESYYPSSESNYPSSESYGRSNESSGRSLNLDSSFTDEICSNTGYSGDNESFDRSTSNSSSLLSDENTVRAMLKGKRNRRGKMLMTNAMHYRRS